MEEKEELDFLSPCKSISRRLGDRSREIILRN